MYFRTRHFIMVAALAVAGFLLSEAAAFAQPCTCDIVDGCKVLTYYDDDGNITGTETICPSTGSGTFNCDFVEIPPTGPINLSIPPVTIDAHGDSPLYGAVDTRIDPDRPSSNATIVSNGADRFPLSVRFSFYARSSVAGREYCSRDELVFSSREVNSFRPFERERFCLERDVEFYLCDDDSQKTAFVLHAGQTCVTLN